MQTETKTVLGLRGEEVLLGDATGAVQAYSLDAFDFPPVFGDKVAVISFDDGSVRVIRDGAAAPAAPLQEQVPPAAMAGGGDAAQQPWQAPPPFPPQPAAAPAPAAAPPYAQEAVYPASAQVPPPPPPMMDSAGASYAAPPMGYAAPPMGPLEALTSVYIKKFADFFGRASRSEFWWSALLFNGALAALMLALAAAGVREDRAVSLLVFPVVLCLAPNLAVMSRRLHDIGRSGWTLLWNLVPIIGQLVLLVLLAQKGKDEANKFDTAPPSAGRVMLNKGFAILLTLGLLAWHALASSSYWDYVARTQVSSGDVLASNLKIAVTEYFFEHDMFPDSNEEADAQTQTGQYATATITEGGVIEVEMLPSADRHIREGRLFLRPKYGENQNIEWSCESSGIPLKLVPYSCR